MIEGFIGFTLGTWFGWIVCAIFSVNKQKYNRCKRYTYKNRYNKPNYHNQNNRRYNNAKNMY